MREKPTPTERSFTVLKKVNEHKTIKPDIHNIHTYIHIHIHIHIHIVISK